MQNLLSMAAGVVSRAGKDKPADAVLRSELRSQRGLSREHSREISATVFAYYRWFGWLDPQEELTIQLQRAVEMAAAFQASPRCVPESELHRAVPDWVPGHLAVSPAWLRSLQAEPPLWLRARPRHAIELGGTLGNCRLAPAGGMSDALRYAGHEDLFRTPEFHAGKFELQDISSQAVGVVCAPQPGETWWDACAGEGGKTLHLCDLMQNQGLVWATDRAAWRLRQLKLRTARAGLFNYRSALWDGGPKPPTGAKFNGVLVDAPCSGLGTWQRNPHSRWTTQPQDVTELAQVQERLLAATVPTLKPRGRLIYSVCTLTRAETSEVADRVAAKFPELKPLLLKNPFAKDERESDRLWLWPQDTGGNGMFIAAWRKE